MIPLRDENPTRTTPVIVIALIIINCLVFFVDRAGAHGHVGALAGLAMVPSEIVTGRDVSVPTLHPMWLTLFTSMFLHANLVHFLSHKCVTFFSPMRVIIHAKWKYRCGLKIS